jgi:hypothetical protein
VSRDLKAFTCSLREAQDSNPAWGMNIALEFPVMSPMG